MLIKRIIRNQIHSVCCISSSTNQSYKNHWVVTSKVNELKVLRKSCVASYVLNKRHFDLFVQTVSNERINKMGVFFSVSGLTLWIPKRSFGEGPLCNLQRR